MSNLTRQQERENMVIAMRAAHDIDMQQLLRAEGIDPTRSDTNLAVEIENLAADQKRRLQTSIEELERSSGVTMENYGRVYDRGVQAVEFQEKRIARDAERAVQGQLESAKIALDQDRQDRFQTIASGLQNDAIETQNKYGKLLERQHQEIAHSMRENLPFLSHEDRQKVADTAVDGGRTPEAIVELSRAPERAEQLEQQYERKREQEQSPARSRDFSNAPSPNR